MQSFRRAADMLNDILIESSCRVTSAVRAQGLVEYGLILAIIALVAMTAMKAVGGSLTDALNEISNDLQTR